MDGAFAVDVCAHAVMHNHTHLVLRVDVEQARNRSMDDSIERWRGLFAATLLTQRYLRGALLGKAELVGTEKVA